MQNHRPLAIRQHDDGIDRWAMVEAAPAARLAGCIDGYGDYAEHTVSFSARKELAATHGVLIYALGDPLEIVGADGRSILIQAGEAFVGGMADATSISRGAGNQAGVYINMPATSLAAVTGVPLAEIANCVVPLADVIGAAARDLGDALGNARDPLDRFDLLDDFLIRRFAEARSPDRATHWAMHRLASLNAPSVSRVADEIGWSRKHLAERFRVAIGLSPQSYRRLARFERFTAAIRSSPDDGLALLALDAGYHDQPHMARDVRSFSAMTPGELRERLIPAGGGVRHD